MPELPEVKTVVKKLNENASCSTIKSVNVRLSKLLKNKSENTFTKILKDKKIKYINNVGKFIVFHLSDNVVLVSHLRMEGKYRIENDDKHFGKHDHIIFDLKNKYLVYTDTRQFGTFHIFSESEYLNVPPLDKLAPEPIDVDVDSLFKRLSKKSIAIKSSLLDQTLVVGLGNIYVNEVLWDVKINPTRKSNMITKNELKKILASSQRILDQATSMGGTTIHSFESFNGSEGGYQTKLNVHGKENQKCKRCGTKILKIKVNGRGTYYCPKCQKN